MPNGSETEAIVVQMCGADSVGDTLPVVVDLPLAPQTLVDAAAKKFRSVTKKSRAYHGITGVEITATIAPSDLAGAFVVFSGKAGWKGAQKVAGTHARKEATLVVPVDNEEGYNSQKARDEREANEKVGENQFSPAMPQLPRNIPAAALLRVGGVDDAGRRYETLGELWAIQAEERERFYAANSAWWEDSGYGGATDEEAMIGDAGSPADVEHSGFFLDGLLKRSSGLTLRTALDVGAGVGRVTKYVLLKRCTAVHLLEASPTWSKQSRRYLGKKRSATCTFLTGRLEEFTPKAGQYDLIWVQWCLQYLTDLDVVAALGRLAAGLTSLGILVVKENRPYLPGVDQEQFQMDTPSGEHHRFDITRPDEHHRILFALAKLAVAECERGEETNTWVLRPDGVAT